MAETKVVGNRLTDPLVLSGSLQLGSVGSIAAGITPGIPTYSFLSASSTGLEFDPDGVGPSDPYLVLWLSGTHALRMENTKCVVTQPLVLNSGLLSPLTNTTSMDFGGVSPNEVDITCNNIPIFTLTDSGLHIGSFGVVAAENLEVDSAIKIGQALGAADGTIRYTGTDFEGRKGGAWVSLTAAAATLNDLTDVTITAPTTDQVLKFNGTQWINSTASSASAGNGIEFFMDSSNIIPVDSNNDNEVNDFTRAPSGAVEDDVSVVCSNNTVLAEAHLYNTALNRTFIDAGVWDFDTWANVDNATGVSEMLLTICRVRPETMVVTTTGSGTSRTATAASGTPFNVTDLTASATVGTGDYLQTPQGLYKVTARTDDVTITIETPSTYVNETDVVMSVWHALFQISTGEINNISPTFALYNTQTVQPSFPLLVTDMLGELDFGRTDSVSSITITHAQDGTDHYSHVATPLSTLHNDLTGLQGGAGDERYHLTLSEHTSVLSLIAGGGSTALTLGVDNVTSTSHIASTNSIINVDATSGDAVVHLPVASTVTGRIYRIKKTDASVNTVTIDPNGSELVDGDLTKIISVQFESFDVGSDGAQWFIY